MSWVRRADERLTSLLDGPGRRISRRSDDGFVLLESILSISLITIIMASLTVFFTTTIKTSNHLRRDQSAAQLADDAIELARAYDGSSVLSGRDANSVNLELSAAPSTLRTSWLNTMTTASDAQAATGQGQVPCPSSNACALLPTTPIAQTLSGLVYQVNYYVGYCYRAVNTTGTDCTASSGSASDVRYLRVVVSVTWPETTCGTAGCLYVTSTFIDASVNPIFNLNSAPPPAPNANTPANQTSAVSDTVNLTLSASSGVPPFTWTAANLPAGLSIGSDGTSISGIPTTVGTARTVTLTVTDAFLRTDTTTFTWAIIAALAAPSLADQVSTWHSAISPISLQATGGTSPYTWSDASQTLPPGLSITTGGVISGTPTTVGDYPVILKVTDAAGRSATTSLDWQVNYPPLTASQSNVTSTVNASTSVTLTASGGSGSYAWSDPSHTLSASGLGLSLSPAGVITGTPTVSKAYSVSVLVTDATAGLTKTVNFSWTVVTLPTVISPGNQAGTIGRPVNVPLTYNCTASPCTITATGLPTGLSISGTSIVGTLPASVTGASDVYAGIQLTIKDASNRSSNAAATFSWTVNAAPALAVTNLIDVTGASVDDIPVTVTRGTGPYTFTITAKAAGTSMTDTGIGELTGTTTTTQTLTGIKMTVVDASGYSVTSAAFTWTVKNTFILQSSYASSYCGVAATSGSTNYLAAGACSSGIQLTYTGSRQLQVTAAPTICVQAQAGTPHAIGATCSAATAQQWLFNADDTITSVSLGKCLDLPAGTVAGTAFDLVTCPPVTSRMQWTIQ